MTYFLKRLNEEETRAHNRMLSKLKRRIDKLDDDYLCGEVRPGRYLKKKRELEQEEMNYIRGFNAMEYFGQLYRYVKVKDE